MFKGRQEREAPSTFQELTVRVAGEHKAKDRVATDETA